MNNFSDESSSWEKEIRVKPSLIDWAGSIDSQNKSLNESYEDAEPWKATK